MLGTNAAKVPTVSGIKEFYRRNPIIWPKNTKKGFHESADVA